MRKHLWLLGLLCFPFTVANARWATLDDAPAISEKDHVTIEIHSDGTWKSERESLLEVHNEEGRTSLGTGVLKYNARTTKLRLRKARTLNKDNTYEVSDDFIEDKPIASSAEGFDDTRQISVAFPKVEIGSKLYLKYSEEVSEVPIPNFYSYEAFFGTELYEKDSELSIHSELPLFVEANDPYHKLEIKQSSDKDSYQLIIRNREPIFTKVIDENDAYLNHSDKTWVVISTSKNYADLAEAVAPIYEKALTGTLPPAFEKILQTAREGKSTIDKINLTTSLLADEVRYLGDWRPRRGGHIPRPLDTIANTKFGDCKDFATVTAAILRRMGMKTYVAWVERGSKPTPLPKLALDSAFNHAIVAIEEGNSVRWIDPTNFASFATGTFEDILGRKALILSTGHSRLAEISIGTAQDSETVKNMVARFQSNGDAILNASLEYRGRSATTITGIRRQLSKDTINHLIAKAIAEDNYVKSSSVDPYDLTSRVVQNIKLHATVSVKNLSLRTTAGYAYQLGRGDLGKLMDLEPNQRVSDLYLGPPELTSIRYLLNGIRVIGQLPKGCSLDSPWMKVTRKVKKTPDGLEILDNRENKAVQILNKDLKGPVFDKFQDQLQFCFHQIAIVYKANRTTKTNKTTATQTTE